MAEADFLFTQFNPFELDCCCFPQKTIQATEYSFKELPELLKKLKEYVYRQLCMAGFSVKESGRMIMAEYKSISGHENLPRHMFRTPGFPRVNVIMVITKDKGLYDSGLLLNYRVPLKTAKMFSFEHVLKTELKEGYGIMYHEDQYVEYVGGDGCFRMICLSFDKR